jgi:hypothetical protein
MHMQKEASSSPRLDKNWHEHKECLCGLRAPDCVIEEAFTI